MTFTHFEIPTLMGSVSNSHYNAKVVKISSKAYQDINLKTLKHIFLELIPRFSQIFYQDGPIDARKICDYFSLAPYVEFPLSHTL